MAETTKISWTDSTFNPWRGCTKIAAECSSCYADTMSKRNPKTLGVWGPRGTRVVAAESYWRQPLKWDREAAAAGAGERRRVFCASLADVFEDWTGPMLDTQGRRLSTTEYTEQWFANGRHAGDDRFLTMDDVRRRLFDLIDATQNLDWLLLTKRPENVPRMWVYPEWARIEAIARRENCWIGTSAGTQATADKAIPELLKCRDLSPVLFVSAEPLLEAVDFRHEVQPHHSNPKLKHGPLVDWIIVGGESGHGARPCDIEWIRSIVHECREAGVACFVKQLGAVPYMDSNQLDKWALMHDREQLGHGLGYRIKLTDKKGGDPSEWPEDLRVQEFPTQQGG